MSFGAIKWFKKSNSVKLINTYNSEHKYMHTSYNIYSLLAIFMDNDDYNSRKHLSSLCGDIAPTSHWPKPLGFPRAFPVFSNFKFNIPHTL